MDNDLRNLTEATELDCENGIEDEFGVRYSPDGKRLLEISSSMESEDYSIKEGTEIICNHAFGYGYHLKRITIPQSVKMIGDNPFFGINRSHSLEIVSNSPRFVVVDGMLIDNVENRLISYSGLDESVEVPGTVKTIDNYAFEQCCSLQKITLPDSITTIGVGAFSMCLQLEQINIPNSVKNIGSEAFFDCDVLQRIVIPESVTRIEDSTFHGCRSLQEIVLTDTIESIGRGAFKFCGSLQHFAIPKLVTSIEDGTFWRCSSLKKIVIPDWITHIGSDPFGLNNFESRSSRFVIKNDMFVDTEEDRLIHYVGTTEEFIVPNTIKIIGSDAFAACKTLHKVVIPNSVTDIGDFTFASCENLYEVSLPSTITRIGTCAFNLCRKLKEITIPESVTTIGYDAFCGGYSLRRLYIPNSVMFAETISGNKYPAEIGSFTRCESLQEISFPSSLKGVTAKSFNNCKQLEKITIRGTNAHEIKKLLPEKLQKITECIE